MMRVLLLPALVLLAPVVSAQGEPVEAWYAITSGGQAEIVRARTVKIRPEGRGYIVTADLQEWALRDVTVTFAGTYDPEREMPSLRSISQCAGSLPSVHVEREDDGSTSTTTTIETSDDGKTTTTTTTTRSGGTTTTTTTTTPADPLGECPSSR